MTTGHVLEVDGFRQSYEDRGSGDAVVLVHGHPFDRTMWDPQVEPLERSGWRVILPDLRGYGSSGPAPEITPLGVFAEDLIRLLDHLGIGSAVFCGLSMGGQIVMEVCRQFPERARGVVLVSTSARAETEAGVKGRYELADRLLREGMEGYAAEVLPKMISPANIERRPDLAKFVLDMMATAPADGSAAALRGRAHRPDYGATLEALAAPGLVVVGTDDEFTPVAEAEAIHRHLQDSRLVVVDGAAHMPNLERSEEFNEVLTRFLDSLRRGG